MPSAPYTIVYDTAQAIAAAKAIDQLTASVIKLDEAYAASKKAAGGFATGAGTSARTATAHIDRLTASMNGAAKAGSALSVNLNVAGKSAGSAGRSIVGMNVAMRAVHLGVQMAHEFAEAFDEARKQAHDAAEAIGDVRDKLRELKSLEGKDTAEGDEAIIADILLSAQTGATVENAGKFGVVFEGAAAGGITKKNITEDTKEKLKSESLGFARMIGMQEDVMGPIAGLISNYQAVPDAEAGMEQVGKAAWGLSKGVHKYSHTGKSMTKLASDMIGMEGGAKDMGDTGIILGAADVGASSDKAFHKLEQTQRLLNTDPASKQGKWLASIGVRPGQDFETKLGFLAPHLAGPGGVSVLDAAGFSAQSQKEGTVAMAHQYSVMHERLEEARGKKFGPDTMEATAKFLNSDTGAIKQRAKSSARAAQLVKGIGAEGWNTARQQAEADLIATGGIDTSETNTADAREMFSPKHWLDRAAGGAGNSRDLRVDDRAIARLEYAFRKTGMSSEQFHEKYKAFTYSDSMAFHGVTVEEQQAAHKRAPEELKSRGGHLPANSPAVLKALNDLLLEAKKTNAAAAKANNPGRPAGKPGAGPLRP